MYTVLIVLHVVLAAGLIALVLVQRGPGATMGAAFGAGASGTVFGSRGSASFLTRLTTWLGVGFFAISLSMAVIAARSGGITEAPDDLGVVEGIQTLPPAEQIEEQEPADDAFLPLPGEAESESSQGEAETPDEPAQPPPD
ncbi:preprotein translocase subunit SecG [Wenzhouxiangella sp. C33]|uniref:Protein-export membrane protein SecG n=1 Tax=Wenzhouxiangella limi TaxID=2707351 RepID=A0A845V4F2_9GAMM|nr:preprotein translocase subunit SecG [Wenzhouxiangella limi]